MSDIHEVFLGEKWPPAASDGDRLYIFTPAPGETHQRILVAVRWCHMRTWTDPMNLLRRQAYTPFDEEEDGMGTAPDGSPKDFAVFCVVVGSASAFIIANIIVNSLH